MTYFTGQLCNNNSLKRQTFYFMLSDSYLLQLQVMVVAKVKKKEKAYHLKK